MTEQLPPVPRPTYPQSYGWAPLPPRTHAEMTWQDLMACITPAFFGLSHHRPRVGLALLRPGQKGRVEMTPRHDRAHSGLGTHAIRSCQVISACVRGGSGAQP